MSLNNVFGCGSSDTNQNHFSSSTTPDLASHTIQYQSDDHIVLGVGGTFRLPVNAPIRNRFKIHPKTPAATVLDLSATSTKNTSPPNTFAGMFDLPLNNIESILRITVWNLSQYPTYILVDSPEIQNGATVMGVAKSIGVRAGETVNLQYDPMLNQWYHADA